MECLGHFDGIAPSLACILTKQHGVRGGKYLMKNPGNAISEDLNFTTSLEWCLGHQELVPLVRVQKPPTIPYQPATSKLFDSPESRLPNITVIQGTYTEKCVTLNSNTIPSQLAGVTRRSVTSVHSWCPEADSWNKIRTRHVNMSGDSQLSSLSDIGSCMVTGCWNCNVTGLVILSIGPAHTSFPLNCFWGISCN